ncbi:hypothetical protein [Arsenicicoccus bolidensis]|uniref:hypothetical protein n=1 Tax=Arsenicicoccus bolidensis TaxID=229480 RepID=UPI0012EC25A1|nr:hypothetical protein [Arsenicicoccus bolidensis]
MRRSASVVATSRLSAAAVVPASTTTNACGTVASSTPETPDMVTPAATAQAGMATSP